MTATLGTLGKNPHTLHQLPPRKPIQVLQLSMLSEDAPPRAGNGQRWRVWSAVAPPQAGLHRSVQSLRTVHPGLRLKYCSKWRCFSTAVSLESLSL